MGGSPGGPSTGQGGIPNVRDLFPAEFLQNFPMPGPGQGIGGGNMGNPLLGLPEEGVIPGPDDQFIGPPEELPAGVTVSTPTPVPPSDPGHPGGHRRNRRNRRARRQERKRNRYFDQLAGGEGPPDRFWDNSPPWSQGRR